MPSDLIKRVNADLIYPNLFERVLHGLAACRARGADYFAIYGHRSWAEQHQLHMRYLNGTGGRAAPAGLSAHNYGLALDFARDKDLGLKGLQPSWDPKDYEILGEEMTRLGLHWGVAYKDRPHIGWPGYVNGVDLRPLMAIATKAGGVGTKGGLLAVWAWLDENQPLNLPPLRG